MNRSRKVAGSVLGRFLRRLPPDGVERPVMRLSHEGRRRERVLLSLGTNVYEHLMVGETIDTSHVAAWQNLNISRTFLDSASRSMS